MKTRHLLIGLAALALAACTQTKEEAVKLPGESGTTSQVQSGKTAAKPDAPIQGNAKRGSSAEAVRQAAEKPFVPSMPGRRISRVSVPGKYVALTFDDGPSASLTPQVLDILKRYGAHGTFFVVGENAARHKSILSRAVAEGNEIGSHTYSHIKMTSSSTERVRSEIERTNAVIEAATGRRPAMMRPPYGATNSNLVGMLYNDYGMTSVLWDVDTRDWQRPGVNVVVQRAVGGAKPGSIILVHDIHASTLAALEDIVAGLQARGFQLVTVSQLVDLGRRAAGGQVTAPVRPSVAASLADSDPEQPTFRHLEESKGLGITPGNNQTPVADETPSFSNPATE